MKATKSDKANKDAKSSSKEKMPSSENTTSSSRTRQLETKRAKDGLERVRSKIESGASD